MPRKSSQARSAGFTLIELLVVIAIIAVLITLLLPAVQQARESARRTQCHNNLSQLVMALQNYEMAFEVLPPGSVNPTGPILNESAPTGYHVSWIVQILPQLELSTAFKHFDFAVGIYDPRNLAPQQREFSVLNCPSSATTYSARAKSGTHSTSYAGCHNSIEAPIDTNNDGLLFLNSSIRYDDITDGAAYTLLLGERDGPGVVWGWASGTRDTLRNTGYPPNDGGAKLFEEANLYEEEFGEFDDWEMDGYSEFEETPTDEMADDEASERDPTEAARPATDEEKERKKRQALLHVGGFNSVHTGGVHFAMADGRVKFLSESIDPALFKTLGGRNDGAMPAGF